MEQDNIADKLLYEHKKNRTGDRHESNRQLYAESFWTNTLNWGLDEVVKVPQRLKQDLMCSTKSERSGIWILKYSLNKNPALNVNSIPFKKRWS